MTSIGRRAAIRLIGSAAALAVAPVARAAGGKAATPDKLRTFMLMRGALDDRLVIGCVSGRYQGLVDGISTPLYGVVSATFSRYRKRPDGGFDAVTLESAYFTDLETGAALDEFRNPYTNEMVKVPEGGLPAAKISFLPDMSLQIARAMPGVQFDHKVLPIETRGDDVWITEMSNSVAAIPGAAQPFRYSETTILHARRSELENPAAKRVRCETNFNAVVSWRPWLKMAGRPGNLIGIGAGAYGATLETLPPAWLAATRERRPELLKDPAASLEPLWSQS